jgi:CBS domain-containing protein
MSDDLPETPVREIMSSPVVTVTADTTLVEAAGVLAEERVGSLVVGTDIVDGIVTETDIVRAVGDSTDLSATTVGDIMSDPVVTIRPAESAQVAGERMGHNGVKKLPVTESGEAVGIVTTTDLAHLFPRSQVRMATQPERDVSEGEFE